MSVTQTIKCFFSFVPFFVLAVYSGSIYDDLHSNDVPDTVPAVKMTRAGQGITAVISSLALVWNFFEFIAVTPIPEVKEPATILTMALIDFLIGTLLLVGVGLQSTYLPHTLSGCSNAGSLGLAAPDNSTNLFRFVGQLDDDTPEDVCNSYLTTWIMAIVLGSVSLLSAYWTMEEARRPVPAGRRVGRGRSRPGIDVIGSLIGLIPWFLSTPIKFAILWLKKWVRRCPRQTHEPASMEMVILKPGSPEQYLPHTNQPETSPKFLELLSSYPIITAIAHELHYVDLIQLSLTSKEIHEIVFPRSKPASNSSLKKHCCMQQAKTACFSCKTQICWENPQPVDQHNFCGKYSYVSEAETTRHLNHCTQYCSKCFRTKICRSAGPRELSRRCSCNNNRSMAGKRLCRFCAGLQDSVLKERTEKKEREEMATRAAQQGTCGGCSKPLRKTGARWWACGRCGKECRSRYHAQWAGGAEV